jgi:hypothetical protein
LRGLGSRIDHFLSPNGALEPDFAILKVRHILVHRLSDDLSLRWDLVGQHSTDVLPFIYSWLALIMRSRRSA